MLMIARRLIHFFLLMSKYPHHLRLCEFEHVLQVFLIEHLNLRVKVVFLTTNDVPQLPLPILILFVSV
jgi:hypothetical protein